MKILFIGPQGSGKSTQGKLLAQHLNIPYLSTGEIFRNLSEEDSGEGKRIRQILSEGKLVDDATTSEIVKKKLSESDFKDNFILDGYPRTLEQLNSFDPGFDKVVYLKVPQEELIQRLLQRGREDDTLELIKTRLELYFAQTEPILDHFRQTGILVEIDGIGTVDQIQTKISQSVNDINE